MKDEDKTKDQLIDELRKLRKQVSELEKNNSQATETSLLTQYIFENAPIGIWKMGLKGEILDVNEHGCNSLGYSKEELCKKNILEIDPITEPEIWHKGLSKRHNDEYGNFESLHRCKDGKIIPVQITEKLLKFGEVDYLIAFVQDISERKKREEEIHEKDILLRNVEIQAKIGGWKVDLKTGTVSNTDEIARIHDMDNVKNINVDVGLTFYTENSREKIEKAFNELVRNGTPYDLNLEIISAKGKHKWVHTTGYATKEQGKIVTVQGSFQDISDLRQAEESLTLTRQIIDKANIGIYIISPEGRIVEANKFAGDLLGYTKEELETFFINDIDIGYGPWFSELEILRTEHIRVHERQHRKKDGTIISVEVHGYILNHNSTEYIIAFVQDITERKNTEKRLRELATTDELTKLMNRRCFFEQGYKEIQKNLRNGQPVSCIIFDIDYFKRVNDTYGHHAGDKVLKAIAVNVKSVIRDIDILARLGGEEFALILPETELVKAQLVAERIREKIEKTTIPYGGRTISVTASLGVTQLEEMETVEDILKRADKALYEAKESGRNRALAK